jgi:pantoate--beta-alanine ligase
LQNKHSMTDITGIAEMSAAVLEEKRRGRRIGVVPTMGYLHEGHRALMRRAREENDVAILTIFVNPTQFGPNEDFKTYPRDEQRDLGIARAENMDYVFRPPAREIYPTGYATYVQVEGITNILEGRSRPGHFRGVVTIVMKLFQITQADTAYFGQKDYQQLRVIGKMVEDLNLSVRVESVPIIREADGLALSSRNAYLSERERKDAAVLYRSLQRAESAVRRGERVSAAITDEIRSVIGEAKSAKVDYIEIVDPDTFRSVQQLESPRHYCIVIAVYIGKTRLIDNIIVKT